MGWKCNGTRISPAYLEGAVFLRDNGLSVAVVITDLPLQGHLSTRGPQREKKQQLTSWMSELFRNGVTVRVLPFPLYVMASFSPIGERTRL